MSNILKLFLLVAFSHVAPQAFSQTTELVILDDREIAQFRKEIGTDQDLQKWRDSILVVSGLALGSNPSPVVEIFYEGLLDNDPKRIDTQVSLNDMDHVTNLIYASYISDSAEFIRKLVKYVNSWSSTYIPTGNTINENKLVVLFWAYLLNRDHFTSREQNSIEAWINSIAQLQKGRPSTPNNNWQAKRMKMIGLAGIILGDQSLQDFAIDGFKKYIGSAYYNDGTSQDLRQRDALHYHVSGLKPCISSFVNFSKFNQAFVLYEFEGESGGSIKRAVDYVVPFARGEKEHLEWVHTTVGLDKKRAEAGLTKYEPGKPYDPHNSLEMFEWATYFDPELLEIVTLLNKGHRSWIAVLNGPAIRD